MTLLSERPQQPTPARIPVRHPGTERLAPLTALLVRLQIPILSDSCASCYKEELLAYYRPVVWNMMTSPKTEKALPYIMGVPAAATLLTLVILLFSDASQLFGTLLVCPCLVEVCIIIILTFWASKGESWKWKEPEKLLHYEQTIPLHVQQRVVDIWDHLPDARISVEELDWIIVPHFAFVFVEYEGERFYLDGWPIKPLPLSACSKF